MPTSRTRALAVANYTNGAVIPPTNLPPWATELVIEFARCTSADLLIWPLESQVITLRLRLSKDGGQTWIPDYWAGSSGGGISVHSKTGLEIPFMTIGNNFPAGNQNMVDGALEIVGGPIRTTAFITLSG